MKVSGEQLKDLVVHLDINCEVRKNNRRSAYMSGVTEWTECLGFNHQRRAAQ